MQVRIKKVRYKDQIYEYEQIVENYRVRGKMKQKVIMPLGRKGSKSQEQTKKILAALMRNNRQIKVMRELDQKQTNLKILWDKRYGEYYIFRKIWESLRLDQIIQNIAPAKKDRKVYEEMIFLLTLYRIINPGSERKLSQTFEPEIFHRLPQTPGLDQWYRAIAYLQSKREEIEKEIYETLQTLFLDPMKILYFDTTSLVMFGEYEKSKVIKYGRSKQKRNDKKQIIVGLLLNSSNIPVGIKEEAGNENDVKNFLKILEEVETKYAGQKIIFVGDKGMNSAENREELKKNNKEYILGVRAVKEKATNELITQEKINWQEAKIMPMSNNQKKLLKALSKKKPELLEEAYHPRVFEMNVKNRRMIFMLNSIEKESAKKRREKLIEALEGKMLSTLGDLKNLIGNNGYRQLLKISLKEEEREKDRRTEEKKEKKQKKNKKKSEPLDIKIDQEKIRELEKFDGITVIETNTNLDAIEIALQYKSLITVEQSFSDLKNTLDCRPIYHKTDDNIRGHIFINYLALLLYYKFFYDLGGIMEEEARYEVLHELKKIQIHLVEENDREYHIRTELTPIFHTICSTLKIKPPDRIISSF